MAPTRVRPYQLGDELGIARLFRACHGRPLPMDLWRWRCLNNPAGPAVIDVAVSGKKIVAHVGTLPVRLARGRQEIKAGLWYDLMVHPKSRDLRLFMKLAEAHTIHCRRAGIRQLYAFPNDHSYPILKRMLNWNAVEEMDALETASSRMRVPRISLPKNWTLEEASNTTLGFDDFWKKARPNAFSIIRDTAWTRWRYGTKPKYNYKRWIVRNAQGDLAGWIAVKVFGEIGDVLDLWADPWNPTAAGLMQESLKWFRSKGVKRISAWALRSSELFRRYRTWGLKPEGPRTHFAASPLHGEKWSVTKGDSDVF